MTKSPARSRAVKPPTGLAVMVQSPISDRPSVCVFVCVKMLLGASESWLSSTCWRNANPDLWQLNSKRDFIPARDYLSAKDNRLLLFSSNLTNAGCVCVPALAHSTGCQAGDVVRALTKVSPRARSNKEKNIQCFNSPQRRIDKLLDLLALNNT